MLNKQMSSSKFLTGDILEEHQKYENEPFVLFSNRKSVKGCEVEIRTKGL
jgi:hypothetical protein